MVFEVCIFGHSYVRDLAQVGKHEILVSDNIFHLNYITVPGATFETFLNNETYFENLKSLKPDFVVVILGGNDLKADVDLYVNYKCCTRFYKTLRDKVPGAVIIASQIENRFYTEDNRFGCPSGKTFDFLRKYFNRFLKNKNFKDCLLQIQGPSRFDHIENYRDGVHLNNLGLSKYWEIIENTMSYAYVKKFVNEY